MATLSSQGIATRVRDSLVTALVGDFPELNGLDFQPTDVSLIFDQLPCLTIGWTHTKPNEFEDQDISTYKHGFLMVQGYVRVDKDADPTGRNASVIITNLIDALELQLARNRTLWSSVDTSSLNSSQVADVTIASEASGILARWGWVLVKTTYPLL